MTDRSKTCSPAISSDTGSAISSPASPGGRSLSRSPDGPKIEKYGPDPVPVSRFRAPDKNGALRTSVTFGQCFAVSLRSAVLQRSLENRLRARLDVNGSPEYVLTWKHWDMPAGRPICALRASRRRTSGNGCGLELKTWPTPMAGTPAQNGYNGAGNTDSLRKTIALLKDWATPRARDCENNGVSIARAAKGVADSLDLQRKLVCLNGMDRPSPLSARMGGAAYPLNPTHFLWLMGYSKEVASCAPTATRSARRSPKSS